MKKGLGGGGQVFTQLGRGKTHEINLAHVYLHQRDISIPFRPFHGWRERVEEEKKWGRKSGRNNLEETFPGLLRISFLFPHSLPPFRCFLRNHCPPTPFPPVFHTLFIFVTIKKICLFQILYSFDFFIHLCFIKFSPQINFLKVSIAVSQSELDLSRNF